MTPFIRQVPKISIRRYGAYVYPYLDVWYNGHRSRLHIGCKVLTTQWCIEKQRAYISPLLSLVDNSNNKSANEKIDAYISRYMAFVDYLCKNNRIENFNAEILDYMARPRKTQPEVLDVFKVINDAVINNTQINERTARNNYIGKGLKALRAFVDYRQRPIKSFEEFDADFIEEFVEYLANGHYKNNGRPYAMSSLNSIIKYAVSAIKCTPVKYLSKAQAQMIPNPQLKDKTSSDNQIALRDREVILLWKYKPESKQDEEIRDMFLLLCLTGQRVSDLTKIKGGVVVIDGITCMKLVQDKCSHKLANDINFPIACEILQKYPELPITNIEKKINENIERIAREAGISGTEQISIHYQGSDKPTVTEVERASLIRSHCGRRTFVSVLSVHGWNYERIGKYTGQSPKIVALYDKSTSIDRRIYERSQTYDRLQVVGESTTPKPQQPTASIPSPCMPQLKSLPNSIDEAKRVLYFLGVNPDDFMEINNFDYLIRLVTLYEAEIIRGCDMSKIDMIKEIFNEYADIVTRKEHLHNLVESWGK